MILQCVAPIQHYRVPYHLTVRFSLPKSSPSKTFRSTHSSSSPALTTRREALSLSFISTTSSTLISLLAPASSKSAISDFFELPDSGGVKALDLRVGSGEVPADGDQVAVHYYGRLAAKQGWRFDSTYDHKDQNGEPIPFVFFIGSGKVISGIETAVKSMKVGGIRRIIIPPSQGYQTTSQEPIPPNAEIVYNHLQSYTSCQWRGLYFGDSHI